ncbi:MULTISPECIES: inositol monophosphatase family protein [Haloprofundus]|uniref:inositol monophosphatase family protein n=1 Tax=Haloprofundus TaxID=1911573 RepID=UPI0013003C06|nr:MULTISPECIES: inositol monophosphatase family protein [Haloprofundus]
MREPNRDHGTDGELDRNRRRTLKALGAAGATAGVGGAAGWSDVASALGRRGGQSAVPRQQTDGAVLEDRYLRIALLAAREAAAIHDEQFGQIKTAETKAPQQLVTEVDRNAERAIRQRIREELGDEFEDDNHALFGEEQGGTRSGDFVWIIDPLDGTTNYVRGIPHFCVSIAVVREGELHAGLVYYSPRDEVYAAVAGEGAIKFEDTGGNPTQVESVVPLSVTNVSTIEESLNSVGFYSGASAIDPRYLLLFREFVAESLGIRQLGAAAVDMVLLAEGAFDTFSCWALKPVDVAAGTLIVREAGGRVTDFRGDDDVQTVLRGNVLATNGELHGSVLGRYRNPRATLDDLLPEN